MADIEDRKFWRDDREASEECLSVTSNDDSPWYVVPVDSKKNARPIVSQIVVDTPEGLGMHYPEATAERARQLQSIRAVHILTLAPTKPSARRRSVFRTDRLGER